MASLARRFGLGFILLLAFALRVFRLDAQSLWADEGASAVMATRDMLGILAAAAEDIHPPLYYLLLHWWAQLAGNSEFALRFLSLLWGITLVAVVFKLGERLLSQGAALIAALLAAFAPVLVYYSQETRMYMMVAVLSALSAWFFLRMCAGDGWRAWTGYVLSSAAALYTQYFAFSVILFENIVFLALFGQFWRRSRLWAGWIVAQLAIVFVYSPWLLRVWEQLGMWQTSAQALSLPQLAEGVGQFFAVGPVAESAGAWVLLPLILAGLIYGARRNFAGLAFLVLYLFVPFGVMYFLSLRRPVDDPKLLLPAAPAFFLLLAWGIVGLVRAGAAASIWRQLRLALESGAFAVGLGLAALVLLPALFTTYFDPAAARDDYRGLVRQIERFALPGDAILLNAPGQVEIFDYYYRGELPHYPLPRSRPLDEGDTRQELEEIAARHRRLWLVSWAAREADPSGLIEGWLAQNAFRGQSRWYGNVQLIVYGLPSDSSAEGAVHPLKLRLGDSIQLLGYTLNDDGGVAPGGIAELSLYWRAQGPVAERYNVFAHLIDESSYLWGQHDSEPAGGTRPSSTWSPGDQIEDRHGIVVAQGTPPGSYAIEVGLYSVEEGKRLPVFGEEGEDLGDRVLLGPVVVVRPQVFPRPEEVRIQHRLTAPLGPLHLLGYDLTAVGSDQAQSHFAQGEVALLTLYWQAARAPESDYRVTLRLSDERGTGVFGQAAAPAAGQYPTSRWMPDEMVRDQHRLRLEVPPGRYRLAVGLEGVGEVELGQVEVSG